MHAGHGAVGGDDDGRESRRVQQHAGAAGLGHPEVFVGVAELDGVGVVVGALAADDVHLKAVFVHGGVLLALPDAERGVHFFQHAQHGAVYLGKLGRKDDAFSGVPQQVNVAGGECVGL